MRSHWIRVDPKPIDGCPERRVGSGDTERHRAETQKDTEQTHRETSHVRTEAEIGVMLLQAKDYWEPPEARTMQGRILPFRRSVALPTPLFRISRLQNCERMCFCGIKSPSLWYFATADLANKYNYGGFFVSLLKLCTPEECLTRFTWPLPGFFVGPGRNSLKPKT